MQNKGLVSIIMAVYNCGDYLRDSLDSIIEQTYTNWHLIICNDASSDNTLEIVNEYKAKYHDKITVISNETNQMLPRSLNRCLEYADGEFVARMDGDDRSAPDRFEKQVKFLSEHPEIDLVGTGMRVFNGVEYKESIKRKPFPELIDMRNSPCFCHATIMARRDVYTKLNGYCTKTRAVRVEDVDLWFRFFAAGFKGANIQEDLYIVTVDENTVKRRKYRFYVHATRTRLHGYRICHFPIKYYYTAFLPVITGLVPGFVKRIIKERHVKSK